MPSTGENRRQATLVRIWIWVVAVVVVVLLAVLLLLAVVVVGRKSDWVMNDVGWTGASTEDEPDPELEDCVVAIVVVVENND